jgi:hypothetical protein
VYPLIVAKQQLGKNVTAAIHMQQYNSCTHCFLCGPCRIKESSRLFLPRTSCLYLRFRSTQENSSTVTYSRLWPFHLACAIQPSENSTEMYFELSQDKNKKKDDIWSMNSYEFPLYSVWSVTTTCLRCNCVSFVHTELPITCVLLRKTKWLRANTKALS